MIPTTISLLFATLGGASASLLARQVPQVFDERSVRPSGGWSLIAQDGQFCPNDLAICGTDKYCCPTSLTCQSFGGPSNLCCPGPEGCVATYQATPYCADDTWSLWDLSQGGINKNGYFCCAPGLVGLMDSKCVDPATISSPSLEGLAIKPGGGVLSTSASMVVVSTAAASGPTGGVIGNSTVTPIMTASSISPVRSATTIVSSSSATSKLSTTTSNSAPVSAGTGTSTSSSASVSPTKSSDGNKFAIQGFGFMGLALTGLALLVGAVF